MEIGEVQERGKRKKVREKEGCENSRIVFEQVKFDNMDKTKFQININNEYWINENSICGW